MVAGIQEVSVLSRVAAPLTIKVNAAPEEFVLMPKSYIAETCYGIFLLYDVWR